MRFLQGVELVGFGQFEADGQGGHRVEMGAALFAGEDGAVNFAEKVAAMGQDHRPARAAEAFVGGGHDHVGNADGAGMYARSDQTGDVGDVGQQVGAHFVGDVAEALPIDDEGVGRETGDDDLRLCFQGNLFDGVIVEFFGFFDLQNR